MTRCCPAMLMEVAKASGKVLFAGPDVHSLPLSLFWHGKSVLEYSQASTVGHWQPCAKSGGAE